MNPCNYLSNNHPFYHMIIDSGTTSHMKPHDDRVKDESNQGVWITLGEYYTLHSTHSLFIKETFRND